MTSGAWNYFDFETYFQEILTEDFFSSQTNALIDIIPRLDHNSIRRIIRESDVEIFIKALIGYNGILKIKFMETMNKSEKWMNIKDMELLTKNITETQIINAQNEIVKIYENLESQGNINFI